jgi:hypothetical protein
VAGRKRMAFEQSCFELKDKLRPVPRWIVRELKERLDLIQQALAEIMEFLEKLEAQSEEPLVWHDPQFNRLRKDPSEY